MGSVVPYYPTYVVIPFKDEPAMTKHVVELCLQEEAVEYVLLYDNGSSHETKVELSDWFETLDYNGKEVRVIDADDLGIYAMWNAGWDWAIENENRAPFSIAFLNNDVDFIPGTLSRCVFILRRREDGGITYPNYDRPVEEGIDRGQNVQGTHGTKKDGGFCGHFFVTRGEFRKHGLPRFDEQFEWWYGDDQFAYDMHQFGGGQFRLVGYPVDHVNEGTASNGQNDWTHEAKARDAARWRELHG